MWNSSSYDQQPIETHSDGEHPNYWNIGRIWAAKRGAPNKENLYRAVNLEIQTFEDSIGKYPNTQKLH